MNAIENIDMAFIFKDMRQVKKHSLPALGSSLMKSAMGVVLTSAVLLLPTARAEDAATSDGNASQLSKGELKAQRQFKMLDFNQDGKLSRNEVAFIPKLAAAFEETDTNKDGYVTYEEVRAFAVKYRAERGLSKATEAAPAATSPSPAAEPVAPAHTSAEPAENASNPEAVSAQPESK